MPLSRWSGSVPDSEDTLYEKPVKITETTVLRAVSVEPGKLTGNPATFHFILNENDSLPVTSLAADPKEMFGAGGVYTAIQNRNARCDAQVAFFEEEGEGFSAGCSVELHGANSRNTFRKKSFELKFLSRTGGSVSYDLFGDGEVTEFSSLLLRGGSNVNLDTVPAEGTLYGRLHQRPVLRRLRLAGGLFRGLLCSAHRGRPGRRHDGQGAALVRRAL